MKSVPQKIPHDFTYSVGSACILGASSTWQRCPRMHARALHSPLRQGGGGSISAELLTCCRDNICSPPPPMQTKNDNEDIETFCSRRPFVPRLFTHNGLKWTVFLNAASWVLGGCYCQKPAGPWNCNFNNDKTDNEVSSSLLWRFVRFSERVRFSSCYNF